MAKSCVSSSLVKLETPITLKVLQMLLNAVKESEQNA